LLRPAGAYRCKIESKESKSGNEEVEKMHRKGLENGEQKKELYEKGENEDNRASCSGCVSIIGDLGGRVG
jgi:hypothetical protein